MARPRLTTTGISPILESESSATASPARGRETRTALLQKLRPPPLVHAWDFWHEKPPAYGASSAVPATSEAMSPASASSPQSATTTTKSPYNTNLSHLHAVTDVRTFWTLFNNFSFSSLPPKTSVHLFHKSVMPLWEDPRNSRGGSWTFRLSHSIASTFFRSLALLAIGEQLQEAITVDPNKMTFRDDICGISFCVKSERITNVQVWNRDAENQEGISRLLNCILEGSNPECKPREGQYYYKKHKDHAGFSSPATQELGMSPVVPVSGVERESARNGATTNDVEQESDKTKGRSDDVSRSVQAVEEQFEKVRRALDKANLQDAEMEQKLAEKADKVELNTES